MSNVTIKSGSYNGGVMGDLSREWATRPADERITGKDSWEARQNLQKIAEDHHANSRALVAHTQAIEVRPTETQGLVLVGKADRPVSPSFWAMTQLCQRAGVPASYLRDGLIDNAALAAQCLNYGLRQRPDDRVGLLLTKRGEGVQLAACTGPDYGRIWNKDVLRAVNANLDDKWTVPGLFGEAITEVTKENTSLFLSAQDMFIGLTDETRRIEIPNRRAGKMGTFARGILIGNSEVGAAKLTMKAFLFDYACANRNFWGVEDFVEVSIRHSSGAPGRFMYEAKPAIQKFLNASTQRTLLCLEEARKTKLPDPLAFLQKKFTRPVSNAIIEVHKREEGRPIETVWDANVGATAYARGLTHQDDRLKIEMLAAELMPRVK